MARSDWSSVQWRKSSRSSANGECVEVARGANQVAARDSKNSCGPILVFRSGEWATFLRQV